MPKEPKIAKHVPKIRERYGKLNVKKLDMFCEQIAQGYSVTRAAMAIGASRRHMYSVRKSNDAFRAAWDEAEERGTDMLEDQLRSMAVDDRNVTAVIFALKARRPEKYRERRDITTGGRPLWESMSVAMDALEHEPIEARMLGTDATDVELLSFEPAS